MRKRVDRLHTTLREHAAGDAARQVEAKLRGRRKADHLLIAEKLGAKHRNYDNSIELNPYDVNDPRHAAYRRGWIKRDGVLSK